MSDPHERAARAAPADADAGRTSPCASRHRRVDRLVQRVHAAASCSTSARTTSGFGAWLGQPESADRPFILVLAQFLPATDPFKAYPQEVLAPFAHLGIELPTREALDEIAATAPRRRAAWRWPPHADAAADRLHVHAARSRRQHDRVLLRPGRVRHGPGSLGAMTTRDGASPARTSRRSPAVTPTRSPPTSPPRFVNEHASALGRGCVGRRRVPIAAARLPRLVARPALRRRVRDRRRRPRRRAVPIDGDQRRPPHRRPWRDGASTSATA